MPEKYLVTGGGGFIGRAAVLNLLRSGQEVVATCRGAPPFTHPGLTWISIDLSKPDQVRTMLDEHPADRLVALAWYMGPGNHGSSENYEWIAHSINLVTAFANNGGRRVVFCGSCMEYDWREVPPFAESSPTSDPHTDYGKAKSALQHVFEPMCRNLGVASAWVRPFFLYGPGENPRRLVADVARSLLAGEEALCSAGTQELDFLHVEDVASAIAGLGASDASGTYNICSGLAHPVREIVLEIGRQIGREDLIKLGARPTREGEPACILGTNYRLREAIDWAPSRDIEAGLADTIAYWRGQMEHDQTGNIK